MHTYRRATGFEINITLILVLGFLISFLPGLIQILTEQNINPPPAFEVQRVQPGEIPTGLSANDWGGMQSAIASAEYHFAWHQANTDHPTPFYWAPNRAQGWNLIFTQDGALISPRQGNNWKWGISLTGYGPAGNIRSLSDTANIETEGSTLTYQWDKNLSEWWVNGPSGLEQGFTILEKPVGSDPYTNLVIEMAVTSSLIPVQVGDQIAFQNDAGQTILNYGKLHVSDADSKVLPAWFELDRSESSSENNLPRIRIMVEDGQAAYPLTIDPWVQSAKLTASDGAGYDRFGYSVAISGDTVVVGDDYDGTGSAYVFVMPGGGWTDSTETAKLTPSDGLLDDAFGSSVAISGDTVVVGAPGHNGSQGSAYVFVKPGGGWATDTETARLDASDPAAGDEFGTAVSISGNTVVVGAPGDDDNGSACGSVYVFQKPGSGWTDSYETAKLAASDGADSDQLGASVGISDNTIVAGALGDDSERGSAYVFVKSGGQWENDTETGKLTADDGASGDLFGISVAISEDTVVVGASEHNWEGAAYVFVEPGGGWATDTYTETAKLTSSLWYSDLGWSVAISGDTVVVGVPQGGPVHIFIKPGTGWVSSTETATLSAPSIYLGWSVAISGDTVIAGGKSSSVMSATYVFVKPESGWEPDTTYSETATLDASDCGGPDYFGESVAISGDTIVVGAYGDNDFQGAAYIFEVTNGDWITSTETAKLTASDGDTNDYFGKSVAIDADTVIVGAPFDEGGGSAYVFVKPSEGWATGTETAWLTASDRQWEDWFGHAVGISGDTIVVGAPGKSDCEGCPAYGLAYVFVKSGESWVTATETAQLSYSYHNPNYDQRFGTSVAIDGDTIVIGKPDPGWEYESGEACVFVEPVLGWSGIITQTATIRASDYEDGNGFGSYVAISGETIVVGAPGQDSAYVFEKPGTGWDTANTEDAKLTASDGGEEIGFGSPVGIYGDTVVVGADGLAYIFEKPGTGWVTMTETSQLALSDGDEDNGLGDVLAMSENTLVFGAPEEDRSKGAAYIFKLENILYLPLVIR